MAGQVNEVLQQSVIDAVELSQKRVRSLDQKTAQRLRIGEALQSSQVLKGAVRT